MRKIKVKVDDLKDVSKIKRIEIYTSDTSVIIFNPKNMSSDEVECILECFRRDFPDGLEIIKWKGTFSKELNEYECRLKKEIRELINERNISRENER